jgi:transposase
MVKEWIANQDGKLKLFLLPGYSPELNPDELVWNSVKNHGLGRKPHATKEELKRDAIAHLRKLLMVA